MLDTGAGTGSSYWGGRWERSRARLLAPASERGRHTAAAQPLPSSSRAALFAGGLIVAAFLSAFGAVHYGFYTRSLLTDTPIYERYGDAIVHSHKLPYRDFAVEYPPGALPAFAVPALAAPRGALLRYRRMFESLMLVCGAAAAALVGYVLALQGAGRSRLVGGTLLAGLAPLALGPVVLSRFDLWPAALTIAGLAALVAERRRLGFVLLGAAVAAKLYPAVLLPLAFAYVWRREGRREAVGCAAALGAALATCIVPFAIAAPHGLWASLSGQASRPLQIESLGASLLLAAHQAWGLRLTVLPSHGSDNLAGHLPNALALAEGLIAPAAIVAIWIVFARGPAERDRFLRYCAAAVCVFVALGKVLSPQYLIWLFALVPLVRGRRGLAAASLFLAAMVLTQLWFPYRYIDLVYGLDPRASWLVLARDLVLVALLVTLVWPRGSATAVGVSIIATLALAAAAAVAAAAASPSLRTHSGLLDERGVPTSCARARAAPGQAPGVVRYDTAAYVNGLGRPGCVSVAVTAKGGAQLFSAAYLSGFDPADPRAHYLGDAGRCTNTAGAGRTLSYSFRVPGDARFVVEVEPCSPGGGIGYTAAVRGANLIG